MKPKLVRLTVSPEGVILAVEVWGDPSLEGQACPKSSYIYTFAKVNEVPEDATTHLFQSLDEVEQ